MGFRPGELVPVPVPAFRPGELVPVPFTPRGFAKQAINQKWDALQGAPGEPINPSDDGVIQVGVGVDQGHYREYVKGRIYYQPDLGAFWVYGSIGDKYSELGGPDSWLGWPISDDLPFAQDGSVSIFQNGVIYWWPDTGAIELGNISLQYKGLYCFGETDEISESDEPYVIFGVVATPNDPLSDFMTQIYTDVDKGDSRPDNIELFRGVPNGLALGVTLMERDHGDRDKHLAQVKQGVAAAGEGVAAGCAAVPYVGKVLAPACVALWEEFGPDIVKFVNSLLGTDDDLIETWVWQVTAKEMVTMARAPLQNFWGIEHHLQSKFLSDGEASYKVYLAIHAV